ncbi:hypothetical protein FZEAL_2061 [Fusarium zealandicum]|uniref:Uncharacterized protein n=1 Tax=Fusarium zealandicum TaxID=1053134 RepID=A0A8H4XNT1_9HYPO|nr:hypothetical protein FZEAL_2061 [Fusarium zealandicum]
MAPSQNLAANLETKLPAQGALKVRLDYGLATQATSPRETQHRWVYSSYLVFNEPVSSITDGQLRMIAQTAHKEMLNMAPSVMTIMAFDNKIILSSSQKGRSEFINSWPDSPVKLSLDRCSSLWRERVNADSNNSANSEQYHKNSAKCGEVNGFFKY